MSKATLYLMVGYPGSGKTTASKFIRDLTGAEHLWADYERKHMFGEPTHTHIEHLELYDRLNEVAGDLLAEGKSVVYDTNFNFFKDREKLRKIAAKNGARTIVVWVMTPKDVARERATKDAHKQTTRVLGDMPVSQFERIAHNLEMPRESEHALRIDGTTMDMPMVAHLLEEYNLTYPE
jgi:predicted kinase